MAAPDRNLAVDVAKLLRARRRGKAAADIRPQIAASDEQRRRIAALFA
jgi:hypothetical protein